MKWIRFIVIGQNVICSKLLICNIGGEAYTGWSLLDEMYRYVLRLSNTIQD